MATAESVAIREEVAIARIEEATRALTAEKGKPLYDLTSSRRIPPLERQAVTLELLADWIEGLVTVLAVPVILEPEPEKELEDAIDHHTGTSRVVIGQKAQATRRGSQTIIKRGR